MGNRALQKVYFDRLIGFINTFMTSAKTISPIPAENDFIYDLSFHRQQPYLLKDEDFDISALSISEQLAWKKERFLSREVLPALSVEKRMEIESRHLDKKEQVSRLIEQKIIESNIIISDERKAEIIEKVAGHYLLSMQYYAPAVAQWMDVLLQHAQINEKKLVFLARDGIVFHQVAEILLERQAAKYGNYPKEQMKVAWLSRKSAQDATKRGDLATRYLKQLGINETEPLIFVDTGMTGTIQKNIAQLIPNVIESQFSVSRNPIINGFWDHSDFSLQALSFIVLPSDHPEAWANDPKNANDWLEDTHRGNYISADRLEDDLENGLIYPVPSMEVRNEGTEKRLVVKETAIGDDIELSDHLIREFGRIAVIDYAREVSFDDSIFNYDEIKINFNDLLTRIQKGEMEVASCQHD